MKYPTLQPRVVSQLVALALLSTLSPQLSTFAQGTAFTYQGRVLNNGTNFNGTGQFKFALVTSTNNSHQATATANLSGTFVTSYTVTAGGNGYTAVPAVTVSGGGGSGATATANLTGSVVTSITPGSAGSGYTGVPTVTIAPPPANVAYTTYWSNDGTSTAGSEPAAAVSVSVNGGLFTVLLGDPTLANMTAINLSVFTQPNLQLRIWFNDGVNGSSALSPVQNLTPAPYAIVATSASNLLGTLSATQLAGTYSAAVTFSNAASSFNGAFAGNGAGLTNVNAATLGGLNSSGFWKTGGNNGTTAGVNFLGTTDSQPLELRVNGARALRLEPNLGGAPNMIGGSPNNLVSPGIVGATIGGGGATSFAFTPFTNKVTAHFGVVGGGKGNTVSGDSGTVGGGQQNTSSGDYATVGGGYRNNSSFYATVGGGYQNTSSGDDATVPGGENNTAGGQFSFAAGRQAKALHNGSFVWADSTGLDFTSTSNNQFLVRAAGGVGLGTPSPAAHLHLYSTDNTTTFRIQSSGAPGFGRIEFLSNPQSDPNQWRPGYIQSIDNGSFTFTGGLGFYVNGSGSGNKFGSIEAMRVINGRVGIGTNDPQQALHVVGNILATGTITPNSDRNAKADFAAVDNASILERVSKLNIQQWRFKAETKGVKHIGPMAQDFRAAFGLGENPTAIATVDADGVALAAIQGLNEKLEQKETEITELKRRLEKLERLMGAQK